MMELSQRRTMGASQVRYAAQNHQPRKLMVALTLLLVALVAVLVKDRQFWFGSEQATIESDMPESQAAPQAANSVSAPAPSLPAQSAKRHAPVAKAASQPEAPEAPAVTRTVLPPLDVDVVAGDNHRAVHPPAAPKIEVETPVTSAPAQPPAALAVPTNAAEREVVPVAATHPPQAAFKATYPVLAQHMNVQGSVVLQAVISADGMIENLKVLSGPSILASAAEQAVRDWRFKPIFQNGQAVESKAKITVNFTIKVGDSIPSNTLAKGGPSDGPIVNR